MVNQNDSARAQEIRLRFVRLCGLDLCEGWRTLEESRSFENLERQSKARFRLRPERPWNVHKPEEQDWQENKACWNCTTMSRRVRNEQQEADYDRKSDKSPQSTVLPMMHHAISIRLELDSAQSPQRDCFPARLRRACQKISHRPPNRRTPHASGVPPARAWLTIPLYAETVRR